eukprot:3539437-Pyramimonas_sp.AAC.1
MTATDRVTVAATFPAASRAPYRTKCGAPRRVGWAVSSRPLTLRPVDVTATAPSSASTACAPSSMYTAPCVTSTYAAPAHPSK